MNSFFEKKKTQTNFVVLVRGVWFGVVWCCLVVCVVGRVVWLCEFAGGVCLCVVWFFFLWVGDFLCRPPWTSTSFFFENPLPSPLW